jgi:hypothetical protein
MSSDHCKLLAAVMLAVAMADDSAVAAAVFEWALADAVWYVKTLTMLLIAADPTTSKDTMPVVPTCI